MFKCDCCGLCCMNLNKSDLYDDLNRGDGVCKYFDEVSKLCSIQKAGLQGNKELQKLLSAFSRLIQGKIFRNGEIEIPLFQEMELIEFYLLLQGERFAGKITYDIMTLPTSSKS